MNDPGTSNDSGGAGTAHRGLRTRIQDLDTDNIAELAVRARALGDVIRLWYGEGGDVTAPAVREAAKRALDEGATFYIPTDACFRILDFMFGRSARRFLRMCVLRNHAELDRALGRMVEAFS